MKKLTILVLGLSWVAIGNAQTEVPHEFQSGTPARANEVNDNFNTLESAIDQVASDLAAVPAVTGLSREAAQIQSALVLTSGLRWLVSDAYAEQGQLPDHSATAGAGDPAGWSNKFVTRSEVVTDGVIQIWFSSEAEPTIANQAVLLTPTIPESGVIWFECTGDGITDPYLAELNCAFADDPYRPVYDLRKQVVTAFDLLEQSNAQSSVQDFFNTNGMWPMDNAQAGLSQPLDYRNRYIDRLSISNGTVTVLFGREAHSSLQGTTLFWEPTDNGASIEWRCNSSDILAVLLPRECR